MARAFTDRGVTYAFAGEERPWPLDLVPRVLDALEWDLIQRGVGQRVRALEAYLADAYGPCRAFEDGPCRAFEDGVVPWRLLLNSGHFHRAAHGVEPPGGVRIHVAGIDLVRDEAGDFRVLEDNVRVPSGVSYVIENRRATTRIFPSLFAEQHVLPVDGYGQRLLAALRAAAPDGVGDPRVVVLTPGPNNAAYFEHALLARLMGVQLVEGHDLVCRGNRVWMRTTRGEMPVHVVYRRLDDDFLDPLHFRPDSVIGCPGIMSAAQAGNVTLANAVGNGIADDKLLYTYVPDLIRYYLAEEPVIPDVESFRPEEPGQLEAVLDQLDQLVVKPVDGAGGQGIVIGPHADKATLDRVRKEVIADPRGWIAQRPVALSTSPTLAGDRMAPRHIDLRPFAVNDGSEVWVLPGGLTRVADSWRFVVLGRSLERVDMTVRLLSVRVLDAPHAPDWPTLLSASGADEAYARVYGGFGDTARVAEFLIMDREFPRSVLHALTTAEECLTALGRPRQDPARRPIGRMRTRLEYQDSTALEDVLPSLLRELQTSCMASAEAVAEKFFPYQGPVEWAQEGA